MMNAPETLRSQMIPAWIDDDLIAVEKLEVHRRGLLHKAVSVFVVFGSEVLIQRRALSKYHTPGLWANTCCTHPRWNEAPEACAERRLFEELGLSGLPLVYCDQVTYRADVGNDMIEHEQVDIFLSHAATRVTPRPNPAEVMETEWVAMKDLLARVQQKPEVFTPWLRIYLSDHAKQIFG